jgi:DNA-binding PadR family transcriptional regulator
MKPLPIAQMILGLLLDAPAHGYELRRCLAPFFGADGPLNAGLLYPALAQLEANGWVRKKVVTQSGAPDKHVYAATRAGARELVAWTTRADPAASPARYDFFHRDPLLARVMFFKHLPPGRRRGLLETELARTEAKRVDYEQIRAGMRRRRADRFRSRILDLGLRYHRLRATWIRQLLRELDPPRPRRPRRRATRAR